MLTFEGESIMGTEKVVEKLTVRSISMFSI